MERFSKFIKRYYIFLIILTPLTFRNRGVEAVGLDPQLALKSLYWCFGILISFVCVFRIKKYVFSFDYKCMFFYSWFIVLTSFFSPIPLYCLSSSLVFLMFLIIVGLVRSNNSFLETAYLIYCASLAILVSSFVVHFFDSTLTTVEYWNDLGYVEGLRYKGLSGSSNGLGQIGLVTALFSFLLWRNNEIDNNVFAISFLVSISSIIMAWSRTPLIALTLAIAYYFLTMKSKFRFSTCLFVIVVFIIFVVGFDSILNYATKFSRSGSSNEIFTFTGRTLVWDAVWDIILKEPLFGHGYASSKYLIPRYFETPWGWTTVNPHSFFLQLFLSSGFIGSLPVIIVVVKRIGSVITFKGMYGDVIWLALFVICLLETGPIGPIPNYLTLIWFFMMTDSNDSYSYDSRSNREVEYGFLPDSTQC